MTHLQSAGASMATAAGMVTAGTDCFSFFQSVQLKRETTRYKSSSPPFFCFLFLDPLLFYFIFLKPVGPIILSGTHGSSSLKKGLGEDCKELETLSAVVQTHRIVCSGV